MNEFQLSHTDGLLLTRGTTEEELLAHHEDLIVSRRDVGTGWIWYRLPPFMDSGMRIGVELAFFGDALRELTLYHDDEVLYGRGWNEWSEEKEKKRAEMLRRWFSKKGVALGKHSWGEVWAEFDPKSGFGSGGVRFKET